MIRFLISFVFMLGTLTAAAPAPAQDNDKQRASFMTPLVDKLKSPVNFGGFERDERLCLSEALDQFAELFDLTIVVNDKAFKDEAVEDVQDTKVVEKKPIPKMKGITLEKAIRELLNRVPSTSGATYVVRDRHIEITTVQALSKEVRGHAKGPLLPLVHANVDRLLLNEALKLLAEQAEFNVVIDARVGDKAKTTVTARLHNVPIDTAVRLLADMAGLKAVQVDNVLYVTSAENAKALQEEPEKRTLKQSGTAKPGESAPNEVPQ
jgi:type II secretory pathway component HofQ